MDRRADRQLYDNAVYFRPACRNSNAPACFLSAEKLDKTGKASPERNGDKKEVCRQNG